ncbi:MAG: type III-B CRISPR module-associated protein Cmr5 [Planctomycetota bacterium]|nr:MAG: type III-B CRISPR module-associated protein Cmr5 [Planctomycetota bacterium]
MSQKGIEQGRAKFAYDKVKEVHKKDWNGEYKSYVKKFPSYIKTNGLGAALAFAYSKRAKEAWAALYGQVAEWLSTQKHLGIQQGELVEIIIKLDSSKYRMVTVEVLALLSWMRRFAEGMIAKDEGDN